MSDLSKKTKALEYSYDNIIMLTFHLTWKPVFVLFAKCGGEGTAGAALGVCTTASGE